MSYAGDILLGNTINFKFTTKNASLAPTTLAGSPVISAYVGNSTTQITAGITLTVDFDSVTGFNHVAVVASGGNGFATQTDISLVVTTGTVDGVSYVGTVIGSFSIENRVVRSVTDAPTVQNVVDGVWNEPRASHVTAGSFGQGAASVQGNVTGNVAGSVGSVTGAVGSVTGNIGGNVTGSVGSVTATVNADVKKINGTTVNGDGSGTPWGP